jgi:hypothetical protein
MTCVRTGLVALCFTVLASHAQAQAKSPGKDVAAPATGAAAAALAARGVFTKSCPDMVLGQIIRLPDGGYVESSQGWWAEAWTERDMLMCGYGLDKANPSGRPGVRVHYDIAPHKSVDCKVFGPTISCTK